MRGIWAVIGSIVAVVLVGAGIFWATVAFSGPTGYGNAVIEKNSAENWTGAQAGFEKNYAEYEAILVKIDAAAVPAADDLVANTNLDGLRSQCANIAADYNAESRTFLSEDFKSADLPVTLDADRCYN